MHAKGCHESVSKIVRCWSNGTREDGCCQAGVENIFLRALRFDLKLAGVLVAPAFDYHFLAGVELDGVASLPAQVAEEARMTQPVFFTCSS